MGLLNATTQINGLTSTQIAAMNTTVFGGLTSGQLGHFANTQVNALTASQVKSLSTAAFGGLNDTQIDVLSTAQIGQLSTTNFNSTRRDRRPGSEPDPGRGHRHHPDRRA